RFAYITAHYYKYSEERQHDYQEQVAAALRAADDGDMTLFQTAQREEDWLWMVAVRKDEPQLKECIERIHPTWDRVASSESSAVYEDASCVPIFMDPEYSDRWNDSEPRRPRDDENR
ncbi:MAG: hypothetical protein AAGC55_06795, partial [Myxococcota bacterium]